MLGVFDSISKEQLRRGYKPHVQVGKLARASVRTGWLSPLRAYKLYSQGWCANSALLTNERIGCKEKRHGENSASTFASLFSLSFSFPPSFTRAPPPLPPPTQPRLLLMMLAVVVGTVHITIGGHFAKPWKTRAALNFTPTISLSSACRRFFIRVRSIPRTRGHFKCSR